MITADLLKKITLFAPVPETELQTIAAHAADVRLHAEEWLLREGQAAAFYGLLEGRIDVFKNVGGRDLPIASYEPGQYFGEVPLMLGAPAIASLQAVEPSRLVRLEPEDFHKLVTQCRILGGEISKTMMNRVKNVRHLVVETPRSIATVIGHRSDTACYDLRDFLSRNRVPFTWDGGGDESSPPAASFPPPCLVLSNGQRLEAPTFRAVAEALGFQTTPNYDNYDVVIVGGGPAGLAAAVYGASEGLRTLLIERIGGGGQAGTSSRIENYLGFPAGLSGDELSERATLQARRFGAELLLPRRVKRLEPGDMRLGNGTHTVVLDDDATVKARAVILATGVDWRHLETPGLERLVGHGVYYGAGRAEAMRFNGRDVHLVGGGNSAGQAAMYFSSYAKSVTMLVRGSSLADSMSAYLIEQLGSKGNVKIETQAEVIGVEGEDRLEAIVVKCGRVRRQERRPSDGLFVFIGAEPQTGWLPDSLIRDQWKYVCTGRDVMDLLTEHAEGTWPLERDPYILETSIPGVLAAGDVRHGSIKRCSAAVGEGSMAIAIVHRHLAEANALDATAAFAGRRE